MASIASEPRVLALQRVTCLRVIEGLHIPPDKRKILAIVFRVATHTALTGPEYKVVSCMQPSMRSDTAANFGVALDALE